MFLSLLPFFGTLFLGSFSGSPVWTALAWLVRLFLFSFLLRTYIIPWLLASTSKHIRVRSISLRSVRGLYVCTGSQACRIDRITYAWTHVAGARRINIIIEGLNLELSGGRRRKPTRHKRTLTLADLSPSPLARLAWELLGDLYAYFDPYIRPYLRAWLVNRIRFFIRWLPRISQAVTFDLHSAVITLPDMQKMEINAESINIQTALSLTPLNGVEEDFDRSLDRRPVPSRPPLGLGAWRKRFGDAFQRSLDRALGDTRATARMSLHLQSLHVLTLSNVSECKPLIQLPSKLDLEMSVSFNPRAGSIDEQSLETTIRVGDCVVHADSLLSFLEKLKESDDVLIPALKSSFGPTKDPVDIEIPPLSPTSSEFNTFSLSPVESPFFSPSLSSKVPSISTLTSPASPFIEAISSSLGYRRLRHVVPCQKLKGHKCNSTLSCLQSIVVTFSRVSIVYIEASAGSEHSYQAAVQDISLRAFRSTPGNNPFHIDILGCSHTSETYDPEVYSFQFSAGTTSLERHTIANVRHVLTVGRVNFQALVSQWPSPWLSVSPFMCGDPNAAVLALRGHVDGVTVTECLEDLRLLFGIHFSSTTKPETKSQVSLAPAPFPRILVDFSCGPLVGSLICKAHDGYKPLVVELKTKGVHFTAFSHYENDITTLPNTMLEQEIRMQCESSLVVEPIFATVHPNADVPATDDRFSAVALTYHPLALSVETIDIRSHIAAMAKIDDRIGSIACVDTSTLTIDAHISGEALCIEMWHPDVVAAILQILSVLPPRKKAAKSSKLDSTAFGLSMSLGLGRLVVFVTSPDLNPHDDLGLSRGVALRSTISVHSYSLAAKHLHLLDELHERSLTRQKLDLSQEIEAAATAQYLNNPSLPSHFFKLSMSDLLLRGAVATSFEKDDPHIIERDNNAFIDEDFLRMEYAEIQVSFRTQSPGLHRKISIDVPSVKLDFRLSHVYELMLALQTLRSIQQIRSVTSTEPPDTGPSLQVEGNINISSVEVIWTLPKQKLLTKLRNLKAGRTVDKSTFLQFTQAQLNTLYPPKAHSDTDVEHWEELMKLQMWQIQTPQNLEPLEIVADGGSASFRVPFGYVFADLVFDVVIVSKAFRHIMHMTKAGRYEDFPAPEPEGPKIVPLFRISVGQLSLEASDDPFESQLGLIWRAGYDAVKARLEREKAFEAKVATIYAAETGSAKGPFPGGTEYRFNASHTISVQEARQRLDEVHALDWVFRFEQERRRIAQTEHTFIHCLRSTIASVIDSPTSDSLLEENSSGHQMPPLFRAVAFDVDLRLSPPSFSFEQLSDFLHEQGSLPRDTVYSLLVPMHVHFTLSALHATLRDYPLPLLSIPALHNRSKATFEFDTDLVIAEEMGTDQSVDWVECPLILSDQGVQGVLPLTITIPKTIMPVKSYANPIISVSTDRATTFTWGVSYGPAVQDLMRIIDTLTSASRDESPPIGFWDKLKLIFHWTLTISFAGEVLLHLKGSRDPYDITDTGAGFAFCWQGNTKLLINRENSDGELLQVVSDSLIFAIPDMDEVAYNQSHHLNPRYKPTAFRKVCAKFQSGVRFGVGVVLERSCGASCPRCSGPAFRRKCRIFDFIPHYRVQLEKKKVVPHINGPGDTYNGFRSDFVHLSVSLSSSLNSALCGANSFHLTSKSFAHFWSWWSLFDGALSLPIRQGTYYPRRLVTPKLGSHLATIKYRLFVPRLFLMHGYLDDTEETWVDGVSPWIGLKGMIDHFQADFHQRDEAILPGTYEQTTNLRRKAFYAAEVVLKGVDLRALVATFPEAGKRCVGVAARKQRSNYSTRKDLPIAELAYPWYDPTDFIETDWSSTEAPELRILPIAACPYFAYFKRNTAFAAKQKHLSKFGVEESHTCLLGTEPSLYHVQINLAQSRITELEKERCMCDSQDDMPEVSRLSKMITLLQEYISLIKTSCIAPGSHQTQNYLIPSESVSPNEWAEFDNVYQVHSPTLYLDAPIRDILIRYYYCSRTRRGFEYHLATRAVKFIRDQASVVTTNMDETNMGRSLSPTQAAASALRKILKSDDAKLPEELFSDLTPDFLDSINPLDGWSDRISLKKSDYCLLLKPQVVLRGELESDPCVVAAIQVKLQSFAIMDDMNVDDPISGKIMSRNYTTLLGLQAFSPSNSLCGKGRVPLEVLVDLKCESDEFDRLVPQTDAMFHYDKFNRLRLCNTLNSAAVTRTFKDKAHKEYKTTSHLRDQTDLLRIHIPRFTVLASDKQFQCIAHIVTELLLFSDAAHKTRLERLEKLLIKYDFTDLSSAAAVVESLQHRLRIALESERQIRLDIHRSTGDTSSMELLNIRAHTFVLAEELNLLFDAIRLAHDKSDGENDRRSALLLHASSSVISWNMLAVGKELISKLEVQETNFCWLSRQDGSTVSNLKIGNLEAFDGSQDAQWAEILSKHDEPANHPLLKKSLFLVADWIILAPVGGITVYETFEVNLHPIRLQIDSKVGRRIMEYLWPSRRERRNAIEDGGSETTSPDETDISTQASSPTRISLDSPRALHNMEKEAHNTLTPPMRKLASSRSFADLRLPKQSVNAQPLTVHSNRSADSVTSQRTGRRLKLKPAGRKSDAADEMKTRSGQKTFVLVRIYSLDLLLSVLKEGSFECHDARIKTRQLEYHNKTGSFEELVDQFIPSNMTWRGWMKMALQQPLVPVFPVARELFLKTKFSRSGSHPAIMNDEGHNQKQMVKQQTEGPKHSTLRKFRRKPPDVQLTPAPLTMEPEQQTFGSERGEMEIPRRRVLSIFGRGKEHGS